MITLVRPARLEVGEAAVGILLEASGKAPVTDLSQQLAHRPPGRFVDQSWSGVVDAELRGVADRLAHPGETAVIDQIADLLELVTALDVGDFGRVSRLDQDLVGRQDQVGDSAAEHGLFAEQIGLGLVRDRADDRLSRGLKHSIEKVTFYKFILLGHALLIPTPAIEKLLILASILLIQQQSNIPLN